MPRPPADDETAGVAVVGRAELELVACAAAGFAELADPLLDAAVTTMCAPGKGDSAAAAGAGAVLPSATEPLPSTPYS